MSPHIAEKSVFETHSVANVKAIINLVHDLTILKEKFAAASLSPGDFHLIVHGPALLFLGRFSFHKRVLDLVFKNIPGAKSRKIRSSDDSSEKKKQKTFLTKGYTPPLGFFGSVKLKIHSNEYAWRFEILLLFLRIRRRANFCRP